jgi:hypothetical protein
MKRSPARMLRLSAQPATGIRREPAGKAGQQLRQSGMPCIQGHHGDTPVLADAASAPAHRAPGQRPGDAGSRRRRGQIPAPRPRRHRSCRPWAVEHHHGHEARRVDGRHADKQGHVLIVEVAAGTDLVHRAGLAAHGVARHPGLARRAVSRPSPPASTLRTSRAMRIDYPLPGHGYRIAVQQGYLRQHAAVGEHRVGPRNLQRGRGQAVAEGQGDLLDRRARPAAAAAVPRSRRGKPVAVGSPRPKRWNTSQTGSWPRSSATLVTPPGWISRPPATG